MKAVKDRSQTPIGHVDKLRELGLGKTPPPTQTTMSPAAVRALLVISLLVNVALVTLLVVR